MDKTTERRKFARLDLALTVSYRVADQVEGLDDETLEVTSSDISLGGLRLMTPSPLGNGTKLDLEIFLPDEEEDPIKAQGQVVWQSKISPTSFETGVVINGIDDEGKTRFMQFVFDQMAKIVS